MSSFLPFKKEVRGWIQRRFGKAGGGNPYHDKLGRFAAKASADATAASAEATRSGTYDAHFRARAAHLNTRAAHEALAHNNNAAAEKGMVHHLAAIAHTNTMVRIERQGKDKVVRRGDKTTITPAKGSHNEALLMRLAASLPAGSVKISGNPSARSRAGAGSEGPRPSVLTNIRRTHRREEW